MVQEPGRKLAVSIERDAWLSDALGREAFRVLFPDLDAAERAAADGNVPAPPAGAFLTAKVPADRIGLVRGLSAAGFCVVDMNITLERAPDAGALRGDTGVRTARPGDEASVLEIAGSCFRYSRFHLDPAIPRAVADGVKRAWMKSYFDGRRGDGVWVAEADGRPGGFLAQLTAQEGGEDVKVIDLIGVSPASARRGLGGALVARFLREAAGKCRRVRVGTQAANLPSLRLYEAAGFRAAAAHYVLHAHAGVS